MSKPVCVCVCVNLYRPVITQKKNDFNTFIYSCYLKKLTYNISLALSRRRRSDSIHSRSNFVRSSRH